MRSLGDELGYEAMSLYRHVESKDDLIGGMLDLVLEEWELPDGGLPWDAAIRASAISVNASLERHRWASGPLMSAAGARRGRIDYIEALLATLRRGGFDADTIYHAYHVLDAHIFGFSYWAAGHDIAPEDLPEVVARFMATIAWDEYPNLAEHRDQHFGDGPHKQVGAFEFGLDLLLEGLGSRP
jgi:AcrR family transcriptional regulator